MTGRIRSANDDAAREDRGMVLMVVVVAGPRDWQRRCLTALPRRQKSHRVDLAAIGRRRVGTAGDVVRLHVVVDERDAITHANDQLPRIGAGW